MSGPRIQCRYQSTFRRLTRSTAMAGAPSLRSSKVASGPETSHIIFNPPPSTPNVHHTPLKFLPPNDPRRKLYESGPSLYNLPSDINSPIPRRNSQSKVENVATSTVMSTPGTALREVAFSFPAGLAQRVPQNSRLPPPVRKQWSYEKELTQEEVEEVRRLRRDDPDNNSVNHLAYKFGCSDKLVKAIQSAPLRIKAAHIERREAAMNSWGPKKRKAWEDLQRRKELWARDA
ncbi:hypothetical protein BT63DRAFT_420560 [Microthyrium microscopicum]|uniref:60S ribosomal protein L20 n=1 Tax=Microthyrium microscopicum TaxID=703497 RepID=A0A6A6USY9_9PEZI|nr:hypothetical protein BT63DRAFT_420560 [Microthyrium microscopicum]